MLLSANLKKSLIGAPGKGIFHKLHGAGHDLANSLPLGLARSCRARHVKACVRRDVRQGKESDGRQPATTYRWNGQPQASRKQMPPCVAVGKHIIYGSAHRPGCQEPAHAGSPRHRMTSWRTGRRTLRTGGARFQSELLSLGGTRKGVTCCSPQLGFPYRIMSSTYRVRVCTTEDFNPWIQNVNSRV